MKKRKSLPVLLLLLLAFTGSSGVVGYILWNSLGDTGLPLLPFRVDGAQAAELPPGFYMDIRPDGVFGGYAGTAWDRKWKHKQPPYAPQGVPPQFQDIQNQRSEATGIHGGTALFLEDCEDYGGELDLFSAGADIDFFLAPGLMHLELIRPEVDVPADTERIYSIDGTDYDACELDPSVGMDITLFNMRPNVRSPSGLFGSYGTEEEDDGPGDLMYGWHKNFERASSGEPVQRAEISKKKSEPIAAAGASRSGRMRNNFLISSSPEQWFHDMPRTRRAYYPELVPGVDVFAYADQNHFEYLLTYWPGFEPRDIQFSYSEADEVEYTDRGNLQVAHECAALLQHRALAYKWESGVPIPLDTDYLVSGKSATLDIAQPPTPAESSTLPTDSTRLPPFLDYLTYFGGTGEDVAFATTHDARGFAYEAGYTSSRSFSSESRESLPPRSDIDAFVSKFVSSTHEPVYTTLVGGRHEDRAFDTVADMQGNLYLCGETLSPDFPAVEAPDRGLGGRGWDAFLVKLSADTGEILFSYRIGGSGDDRAYGIALDADGNIYLTGMTYSDDFPLGESPAPDRSAENGDAFLLKISSDGQQVLHGARLGGSGGDHGFAVAVDIAGSVYITGETSSTDFPVTHPLQPRHGGNTWDGFAMKFAADGSVVYATYLGGKNDDHAYDIDVDPAGHAYIVGETGSEDFPVHNALQRSHSGGAWDAYLVKLMPDGEHSVFATYLGGSSNDRAFSVTADVDGHAFVGGATGSADFPVTRAVQPEYGGGEWDGFLARFGPGGKTLDFITYIGAEGYDAIHGLSLHTYEAVVFAGRTTSTNLSLLNPVQLENRGGSDTLLGRLLTRTPPSPSLRLVEAQGQPGGPAYDYYIGTYEVTNEEFVRFLNDAQANPDTLRGTNMYYDSKGDIWFNPAMVPNRDEMFSVEDSRIVYRPQYPPGSRYAVTPVLPREGDSYARHPVVGVSWYGAIKYVNYLTIATGRGIPGYREGTNSVDWAPITSSTNNWPKGVFTPAEREAWLEYPCYRLPMDNCAAPPRSDRDLYFVASLEEFAAFLNDVQANPNILKGMHAYFDDAGNMSFDKTFAADEAMMFRIENSGLAYNGSLSAGQRFSVIPEHNTAEGGTPVRNVHWTGAVKFVNVLSLNEGMEGGHLSYREGTNLLAWVPTGISPQAWEAGEFSDEELDNWLNHRGHKLPFYSKQISDNTFSNMLGSAAATNSYPNSFNEFFKAATWTRSTNSFFGYGGDEPDPRRANYLHDGISGKHDTTPVGFFNGSDHDDYFQTRTNRNSYLIYDLSGNVEEWMTDFGIEGRTDTRASYGGSWMFDLPNVNHRLYVHPYFTDNFRGFRVATTKPADDMYIVRIPFRICICGYGVGDGCGRPSRRRGPAKPPEGIEQPDGWSLDLDEDAYGPQGVIADEAGPFPEDGDEDLDDGGGGGDQGEDTPESPSGDGDING